MSKVKMSRAIDLDGNFVQVADVVSGRACNCICIGCGKALIAKKGEFRADHFSHDHKVITLEHQCSWTPETDIHIIAKEIIAEDRKMRMPIGTINPRSEVITFDDVFLELREGNRIPDIIAIKNGEKIYIEIAVTHFCDKEKIIDYKKCNKNCLEVDLSSYKILGDVISKDELRDIINTTESNWISVCPVSDFSMKIHNHNRNEIKKAHKEYKDKKKLHIKSIDYLKRNILSLENDKSKISEEFLYLENNVEFNRKEINRLKIEIEKYDVEFHLKKDKIDEINNFYEIKNNHNNWYHNAIKEVERLNQEYSNSEKYIEDRQRYLDEQLRSILQRKKQIISEQESLNINVQNFTQEKRQFKALVEQEAKQLAQIKFERFLKDKENIVKEYDRKIECAEKKFREVKRKYGSFVKI